MAKITTELKLQDLLNRVIDAGVMRWHESKSDMRLYEWLELTEEEYAAWVEQKSPFKTEVMTWEKQKIQT